VQRFASIEHVAIGNEATTVGPSGAPESTGIRFSENPADVLNFGEIVAMGGDFFASIDEMRSLSADPFGRRQLAFARAKVNGSALPDDADAKKAVMDRYYALAAKNFSHFSAGGTGQDAYETGHIRALKLAWMSGQTGGGLESTRYFGQAVEDEAFSAHFLTDLFSGGHIRTPRADIKQWYADNGFSPAAMKQYLTDRLVLFIRRANETRIPWYVTDDTLKTEVGNVLEKEAGPAINAFSLGDLVSLAMHDYDNERGVHVVSQRAPDGTVQEFHWITYGDKQLPLPRSDPATGQPGQATGGNPLAQTTFDMAVAAARASRLELDKAEQLGIGRAGEVIPPEQLDAAADAAVSAMVPLAAFDYVPHEDISWRPTAKDDMSDGPLGDWRWGRFSPEMTAAFDASVRNEVVTAIRDVAKNQPDPYVVSKLMGIVSFSIDIRWPVQELADELDKDPLDAFERIYSALAGPSPAQE
jgi:hypothetical protein